MRVKTADPDAFPPIFVQNRLQMFSEQFINGADWIKMHRGYCIYKDYLADYYRVIHQEFVEPLYANNFVTDKDLEIWVLFLENNGYPGIIECQRDDKYLHILTTFLWLNVAHASDHTIGDNIISDFGIGASYVGFKKLKWYKQHKSYNFVDVLEGKSFKSRCRLQFHAMRNRLLWYAFADPKDEIIHFAADYFIDSNLYKQFKDIDNISKKERNDLNMIHKKYIVKLKKLDEYYGWLMPSDKITAGISY